MKASADAWVRQGGGDPSPALAATLTALRPLAAPETTPIPAKVMPPLNADQVAAPGTTREANGLDPGMAAEEASAVVVPLAAQTPPLSVEAPEQPVAIEPVEAPTFVLTDASPEPPASQEGFAPVNGSAGAAAPLGVHEAVDANGPAGDGLPVILLTRAEVPVAAIAETVPVNGSAPAETSASAALATPATQAGILSPATEVPIDAPAAAIAIGTDQDAASLPEAPVTRAVDGRPSFASDRAAVAALASASKPAHAIASPKLHPEVAEDRTAAKGRLSPLAGILIGAAAGAVAAALATAVLLPRVMQSIDLRVTPVADRLTLVETRMQQTDNAVGRLNNEIAQALDSGTAVAERVSAQTTALADIQHQLAAKQTATATALADPSVFAVAVVQLRSAFYSGRPFEAELVNVYALARGDEHFAGPLNILSGPARTGVPTAAVLRQELPAFVSSAGLRIGQPQTYYEYSLAVVSQYVGLSTQPYSIEAGNDIVTSADHRLMSGDVNGAADAIAGLDPTLLPTFQPWLEAARVYIRDEAAVSEMTAAVIDSLRQRMGAANAG